MTKNRKVSFRPHRYSFLGSVILELKVLDDMCEIGGVDTVRLREQAAIVDQNWKAYQDWLTYQG